MPTWIKQSYEFFITDTPKIVFRILLIALGIFISTLLLASSVLVGENCLNVNQKHKYHISNDSFFNKSNKIISKNNKLVKFINSKQNNQKWLINDGNTEYIIENTNNIPSKSIKSGQIITLKIRTTQVKIQDNIKNQYEILELVKY